MNKLSKGISIKKNIILSLGVQVISLMVSFILNLIVPKFIPELQYSYWQAYVLYASYVGILHFGLLDGIVLRYSQYDYDQLDKPRIRSQFKILLAIISCFSVISVLLTFLFIKGNYRYIFLLVALGIITKNIFTYTSYTFQITNRIDKYAVLVISQRVFYGIITVILLAVKVDFFAFFCLSDLGGDIFGCIVGYFYNKDLYLGKSIPFRDAFKEFKENISSGVLLLVANWSSMLLVGSAKMIVQWHWDELTFGKVSFSFSISSLFLTFVTAISVVLFPSLKRMEKDKLPEMYQKIRNAVSPVLFTCMLFFFPGCYVLDRWLPKYHNSLVYLGILLPIIIYTSKVSLLTNNYLKAYRKEGKMFAINTISVVIAFALFGISAYIIDNLTVLLVMIVIVIMLRSVASEIVVMKLIKISMYKDFIIEMLMTIIFIICSKFFSLSLGFVLYFVFLFIYLFYYRDNLKTYLVKFAK